MSEVSVLIASYNHARFLPETLASVKNQTFGDWEAIVIDDGSSDDSVEVARRFTSDPRFRVSCNDSNLGTYGTQQRALEQAQGRYVAILNSDDLWAPDKLSTLVERLDRSPNCAYAYALGWMVDEDGRPDQSQDVHGGWPRTEEQQPLPYLLYENRILASSVLFRRENLRFETTCRYSGDWVALLEASRRGLAAFSPQRLSFWRMHSHNTFRLSPGQAGEEIRVRESILAAQHRWEGPGVRSGLAKNALDLSALYAYFGDRARSRSSAARALRLGGGAIALKRLLGASLLSPGALRRHYWKDAGAPTEHAEESRRPLDHLNLIDFR